MDSNTAAVIIAALSMLVSAFSLFAVIWQGHQAARANELNSLISLRTYADKLNYTSGIDVTTRDHYTNYSDYETKTSQEERTHVRSCMDFLSFASHLVEAGFVDRQRVWDIYFVAYRLVGTHLLPWWLEHERETHPQRYAGVERMCRQVMSITPDEIKRFDKARNL